MNEIPDIQVKVEGNASYDEFLQQEQNISAITATAEVPEPPFYKTLNSIENILIVNLIGSALIAGALISGLIMRWFHVR